MSAVPKRPNTPRSTSRSTSSATGTATGSTTGSAARPREPVTKPQGYGNIYTPHAGSMIIQVQRESGLQNRTIVLSPRQVKLLRFLTSRSGKVFAIFTALLIAALTAEAIRVPILTNQIASMQHTVTRLDTLEHALAELQQRYDQVQHMLGAAPATTHSPSTPTH